MALASSAWIVSLWWSLTIWMTAGAGDQAVRNIVDEWMGSTNLFEKIAIDEGNYRKLPEHWRQALAEISVRNKGEDEALKKFVATASKRDIATISMTLPYVIDGNLIDGEIAGWWTKRDTLRHLHQRGLVKNITPKREEQIVGTEGIILAGQTHALKLTGRAGGVKVSIPVVEMTDVWKKLQHALDVNTSVRYLCRMKRHYEENGFKTAIHPIRQRRWYPSKVVLIKEAEMVCKESAGGGK